MESDSEWEDLNLDNSDSGSSTSIPSSESEEENRDENGQKLIFIQIFHHLRPRLNLLEIQV